MSDIQASRHQRMVEVGFEGRLAGGLDEEKDQRWDSYRTTGGT
jgi:hypothetical protein